jgi:hypothetical protein
MSIAENPWIELNSDKQLIIYQDEYHNYIYFEAQAHRTPLP